MAAISAWPAGRPSSCCSSTRTPRSTRQASRCWPMRCAQIHRSQASGPRVVDGAGTVLFTQRRFPRLRSTYAQGLFLHRAAPLAAWTDDAIRDPERVRAAGHTGMDLRMLRAPTSQGGRVGGWAGRRILPLRRGDRLVQTAGSRGMASRLRTACDGTPRRSRVCKPERNGAHPRGQSRPLCPQTPRPCGRRVRGRRAGPRCAHARRHVGPSIPPGLEDTSLAARAALRAVRSTGATT